MIRPMTRNDVPVLIALGADMHRESRYAHLDFDPNKLLDLADSVLADPDTYLALVCEVEGVQVGFCAAYVVSHFFGHDLTSGDFAVYVLPEHRKGMAGVKLIKGYLEWCDSKGVKEPLLGVSAGIMPERIGKLYERLGFTEKYTIYKKPC
jgi:GNAT superfamily N-acetyltransferase